MLRQSARIHSSEPDIQEVLLAEAPTIALHVGTEVKFGGIPSNAALLELLRVHFELSFLSDHSIFEGFSGSREPRHRAEVASRAHQHASLNILIGDPSLSRSPQSGQTRRRQNPRTGTLEQV